MSKLQIMMDILLIVITYGEFAFVNFNISLRRNRFLQGEEEKNNVTYYRATTKVLNPRITQLMSFCAVPI